MSASFCGSVRKGLKLNVYCVPYKGFNVLVNYTYAATLYRLLIAQVYVKTLVLEPVVVAQ